MLVPRVSDFLVVEHLVVVGVKEDVFKVGLGHVVAECRQGLETVVNDQSETGFRGRSRLGPGVSGGTVGIVPVLSGRGEQVGREVCGRFVEERKGGHDLPV